MSPYKKWDSDEVDDFYKKHIQSDFDPWYFPTYQYLLKKGYIGFYVVLFYGKTKKYPNIDSFCKEYWLKRLTTRKVKWVPEYVEEFYKKNILPFVVDNYLPPTSWFKGKWWEYWGFITVLNLWKVKGYDNIKDFKRQKGLSIIRKNKIYNKEEIDIFYKKEILCLIDNNKIPNQKWFQSKDWKYLLWYKSIIKWESGYKWLKDFSLKNNLDFPSKTKWTKNAVDKMLVESYRPLMDWNNFLTYSKIKELWWNYIDCYNALRNKRVKGYCWIKDFKKQNNLI